MTDLPALLELTPTAMVAGGDAIARDPEGRVVFVTGALPGERVSALIRETRRDFARAEVVEVLEPSPDRVDPPCPHLLRGCGGCPWQHIEVGAQRELRRSIVSDALRRIAGMSDPPVEPVVPLAAQGYRTSVRLLVEDHRPAYRRASSHDPVQIDSCLVLHPLIEDLVRDGRYEGAEEVERRAGARTGERMAVAHPDATGLTLPEGVIVTGTREIRHGRHAAYHEEAAGRRWRISAGSFFQIRPDGADVLASLVLDAVTGSGGGGNGRVLDLYAGVGLFAGVIAEADRRVVAVEAHRIAVADARHNLSGMHARVVHSDVARFRPEPFEVVLADPSRTGLRAEGVGAVVACEPERVVLVSCDAAALGRDAKLLADAGYALTGVTPVDLFPHTAHVETVSTFDKQVLASLSHP